MQAECELNLSGWVGGWVGGWFPSDIRANLSSTGAGAGTATWTELGNNPFQSTAKTSLTPTFLRFSTLLFSMISIFDLPQNFLSKLFLGGKMAQKYPTY